MPNASPPPTHSSSPSDAGAQKNCPRCQTSNPPDANYCNNCREPLKEAVGIRRLLAIVASVITAILGFIVQANTLVGQLLLDQLHLPQVVIPPWLMWISWFSAFCFAGLLVVLALAWIKPTQWMAKNSRMLIKWVVFVCLVSLIATTTASFFAVRVQPSVQIDNPAPNSTVKMNTIVYGSASNMPSGQTLWLLLYNPQLRLYYPQDPPVTIQPNGKWTEQVYVGGANDTGKEFAISAVLADQNSNNFFVNYTNHGKSTGDWPGITPEQYQTSGAYLYQQITVSRAN